MINFVLLATVIMILVIVVAILILYLRYKNPTVRLVNLNEIYRGEDEIDNQKIVNSMFSPILPSIIIDNENNIVYVGNWLYKKIDKLIDENTTKVIPREGHYGYFVEIKYLNIAQLKSILKSKDIRWV